MNQGSHTYIGIMRILKLIHTHTLSHSHTHIFPHTNAIIGTSSSTSRGVLGDVEKTRALRTREKAEDGRISRASVCRGDITRLHTRSMIVAE
jgi:hypothetical protein